MEGSRKGRKENGGMEGGEGKWGCRGRMRVTGWERGGTGRGRGVGEGG